MQDFRPLCHFPEHRNSAPPDGASAFAAASAFPLPADLWRQLKVSPLFRCSRRALEVFKCLADSLALQGVGSCYENW